MHEIAAGTGARITGLESDMRLQVVLAGAVLALAVGSANAAELLINGGFENGDLSGWTVTNDLGFTTVESAFGYGPQAGTYYVYSGQAGSPVVLSQTFNDTAGQTLTISGWAIGDPQTPSNCVGCTNGSGIVTFSFNGATLGGPQTPPDVWTQYSFSVTSTGLDTFSVGIQNDPSYTGVDSFSVQSPVAVPGPIAGAGFPGMLVAGCGFLAWRRRHRRAQASA